MENQPNAQSESKSEPNQPASGKPCCSTSSVSLLILAVAAIAAGAWIYLAKDKFDEQGMAEDRDMALAHKIHAKTQALKKKKAEAAASQKAPEAAPAPTPAPSK